MLIIVNHWIINNFSLFFHQVLVVAYIRISVFDHNNPHLFRVGSRFPPSGNTACNAFDSEIDGALWFEKALDASAINKLFTTGFGRVRKTQEIVGQ